MILVDSNVLIDIIDRDPTWFEWSVARLKAAVLGHDLFINPVVVAEVAPRFDSLESFLAAMAALLWLSSR